MPGPPLPIGTWGEISTRTLKPNENGKPIRHLAHARFRDHDGKIRAVTATGTTKTAGPKRAAPQGPEPRKDQPLRRTHRGPQGQPPPRTLGTKVRAPDRRRHTLNYLVGHLPASPQEPRPSHHRRTRHCRSHHSEPRPFCPRSRTVPAPPPPGPAVLSSQVR